MTRHAPFLFGFSREASPISQEQPVQNVRGTYFRKKLAYLLQPHSFWNFLNALYIGALLDYSELKIPDSVKKNVAKHLRFFSALPLLFPTVLESSDEPLDEEIRLTARVSVEMRQLTAIMCGSHVISEADI